MRPPSPLTGHDSAIAKPDWLIASSVSSRNRMLRRAMLQTKKVRSGRERLGRVNWARTRNVCQRRTFIVSSPRRRPGWNRTRAGSKARNLLALDRASISPARVSGVREESLIRAAQRTAISVRRRARRRPVFLRRTPFSTACRHALNVSGLRCAARGRLVLSLFCREKWKSRLSRHLHSPNGGVQARAGGKDGRHYLVGQRARRTS